MPGVKTTTSPPIFSLPFYLCESAVYFAADVNKMRTDAGLLDVFWVAVVLQVALPINGAVFQCLVPLMSRWWPHMSPPVYRNVCERVSLEALHEYSPFLLIFRRVVLRVMWLEVSRSVTLEQAEISH